MKGWCNHPHLSDKEVEVHEAEWPPEVVGSGDGDSGLRAAASTRKRAPEVGPWASHPLVLAHLCPARSAIYLTFLLPNGLLFIRNSFVFFFRLHDYHKRKMSITCHRETVSMKLDINTHVNKGWFPPCGWKSPAMALEHVRPLWAPGS